VGHARAKLTPSGRALLVERVTVLGWAPARAAEAAGVSRPTVYKWIRRFAEEGPAGLLDRTSAPHRRPHALSAAQVAKILRARRDLGWGPHRLGPWLGHPRSTISGVLRRHGQSRDVAKGGGSRADQRPRSTSAGRRQISRPGGQAQEFGLKRMAVPELLDVKTGSVSDFASPLDSNLVATLGGEPPLSFVDVDSSASGKFVATQVHLVPSRSSTLSPSS
jgi:transposase-like protein